MPYDLEARSQHQGLAKCRSWQPNCGSEPRRSTACPGEGEGRGQPNEVREPRSGRLGGRPRCRTLTPYRPPTSDPIPASEPIVITLKNLFALAPGRDRVDRLVDEVGGGDRRDRAVLYLHHDLRQHDLAVRPVLDVGIEAVELDRGD